MRGVERVCGYLQQMYCMRSNAAPAKMPTVSPVRQSIESKPSERSSAERRGLDRFVFKSPACQGVCGKEESTVRKKGACA